jgi:hypothetical protein
VAPKIALGISFTSAQSIKDKILRYWENSFLGWLLPLALLCDCGSFSYQKNMYIYISSYSSTFLPILICLFFAFLYSSFLPTA